MTTSKPNGRADPDTAERLSVAWDDLVTGRPTEMDDEGLVTVAYQLHATTSEARERPGFRQNLRDSLMQSPTIAMPIPGGLPSHRIDATPVRQIATSTVTMLRRTGGRWLSLAATIALLFLTAAGGYLAGVGLPGNDGRATSVAGFQDATPEGETIGPPNVDQPTGQEILASCQARQPYVPGCSQPNVVAYGLVAGAELPGANLDVSQVQMWRFQIESGQRAAFQTTIDPISGIGMDVVINGAYGARFTEPVTVTRNQAGIRVLFEYLDADADVELVRGDVVTYVLGTKVEVRNLLSSAALQFKTVLLYDGASFPDTLAEDPTTELEWRATMDGEGTLPRPVSAYANQELTFVLTYSQLIDGFPFPPQPIEGIDVILGPVDPVGGPVGTEGFILWAIHGQG